MSEMESVVGSADQTTEQGLCQYSKDDIISFANEVLKKALDLDVLPTPDQTFSQLDVWSVDLLDISFKLQQKFRFRLESEQEIVLLKRMSPVELGAITVAQFHTWVFEKVMSRRL